MEGYSWVFQKNRTSRFHRERGRKGGRFTLRNWLRWLAGLETQIGVDFAVLHLKTGNSGGISLLPSKGRIPLGNLIIALKAFIYWLRLTHIMESNLLYSKSTALFIYILNFLVMRGLHCFVWPASCCSKWGLLIIAVCRLLIVAEHRL